MSRTRWTQQSAKIAGNHKSREDQGQEVVKLKESICPQQRDESLVEPHMEWKIGWRGRKGSVKTQRKREQRHWNEVTSYQNTMKRGVIALERRMGWNNATGPNVEGI